MALLQAPEFWVAVAFFAFLGIVAKAGGFAMILKGLDGRGQRVRDELNEAKSLREEAARVLADYRDRRAGAEAEAAAIVADARAEAARLAADAETKLTAFVASRTRQAESRIALAEAQAAADVRAAAADAAADAAAIVLRDGLKGAAGEAAVASALAEVRGRLN